PHFNPVETGALTFEALDEAKYPCFRLALDAGKKGATYPTVLSAADEVAVEMFLGGAIGFTTIPNLVEWVLSRHDPISSPSMYDILEVDDWARTMARAWSG
ncbi:MAG: 1-deoxy-D-xylulose-5-phosphate reductoisomerase, partial [Dehalococcoidia bacterium]|nr:1-deoxy-D-xylulose-5-phosphate reductoisomerase [Dehalococcoidia bacterium]